MQDGHGLLPKEVFNLVTSRRPKFWKKEKALARKLPRMLLLGRTCVPTGTRIFSFQSNEVLKFVIGFCQPNFQTENNAWVPSARRPLLSCFSSDAGHGRRVFSHS